MRSTLRVSAAALVAGLAVAAAAVEASPPSTAALVRGYTPTRQPVSPGGTRAAIDLPASEHMRNTGGSDGDGLCVGTSVTHSARWQGVRELDGFRAWLERRPGGSFPQKLAADLKEYCRQKGVAVPRYVMATGVDARLMELALKTRRMPAITHTAAHMVSAMHLDRREGAILDNNYPGRWEWAPRGLYLDVFSRAPRGRYGWVVVLLAPPPPPGVDQAVEPAPTPQPPVDPWVDPVIPCPDGRCPRPVDPFAPRPCPDGRCPRNPRWVPVTWADGSSGLKLYGDVGELLGVLDGRGWHPATGPASWTAAAVGEPPVEPPAAAQGDLPGGVDVDRIDLSRPRYWLDGEEVPEPAAFRAVGQTPTPLPPGLADDSDRHHLTLVVGDFEVLAARQKLASLDTSRVHVQVYTAADWPVRTGRVKAGVTLHAPAASGGKVLYHNADAGTAAEALKYTDPAYRPAPPVAPPPAPVTPPVAPAPTPKPAPGPCPDCPGPGPCPAPAPAPKAEPAPPPAGPAPPAAASHNGFAAVLAGLLYLLAPLFTRKES